MIFNVSIIFHLYRVDIFYFYCSRVHFICICVAFTVTRLAEQQTSFARMNSKQSRYCGHDCGRYVFTQRSWNCSRIANITIYGFTFFIYENTKTIIKYHLKICNFVYNNISFFNKFIVRFVLFAIVRELFDNVRL